MTLGMVNWISWLLVFHLTGMVFWIGGLLAALAAAGGGKLVAADGADAPARLQRARLAQRSLRGFAHPGAALMVITGAIMMAMLPELRTAAWLHFKLLLVVILIGFDLALTVQVRKMPAQEPSAGQIGMFHGAISLIFLLILVLVLVKPF